MVQMPHPGPQSGPGRVRSNHDVSSRVNAIAQAFLVGGTAVITLLGSLYLTMHLRKKREEERGTNPYRRDISIKHCFPSHQFLYFR
jgi:hypothetical protein